MIPRGRWATGADRLELSLHTGDRCRMRTPYPLEADLHTGAGRRVRSLCSCASRRDTVVARVPFGGGPPYRPCAPRAPVRHAYRLEAGLRTGAGCAPFGAPPPCSLYITIILY